VLLSVTCLLISIHAYIYSYDVSFWLIINYNFMLPFLKLVNQLLGLCLCIVVIVINVVVASLFYQHTYEYHCSHSFIQAKLSWTSYGMLDVL